MKMALHLKTYMYTKCSCSSQLEHTGISSHMLFASYLSKGGFFFFFCFVWVNLTYFGNTAHLHLMV